MFSGLSAFPLTPLAGNRPRLEAFEVLVSRLAEAGVDSIGALGSTGSYAYLSRVDRAAAARVAVDAAGGTPVLVGVGAIATTDVLSHTHDAQDAGASAVLLAPMSYQPLTEGEVIHLYERVAAESDIPVVVYDNPATTGFTFTAELHSHLAQIGGVVSIKLPGVDADADIAKQQISALRTRIPDTVSLGVSGDSAGARGLLAGCDVWYSVLGGLFPDACLPITRAAQSGDAATATALSSRLNPVWELFATHGSYRVTSALACESGIVLPESLPEPVLPLSGEARRHVVAALAALTLDEGPSMPLAV